MDLRVLFLLALILGFGVITEQASDDSITIRESHEDDTEVLNRPSIAQESTNSILINSVSDFENFSSSGDGSKSNPYILENYAFSASYYCLQIVGTSAYFIIKNCTFEDAEFGIIFTLVNNGKIENCSFHVERGIEASYSRDCEILNCTFLNFSVALYLDNCKRIEIGTVSISGTEWGGVGVFAVYSEAIVMVNCTITHTASSNSGMGMSFMDSTNITILNQKMSHLSTVFEMFDCSEITVFDFQATDCRNGPCFTYSSNSYFADSRVQAEYNPLYISGSSELGFANCTFESEVKSYIEIWQTELIYFEDCQFIKGYPLISGPVLSHWVHSFVNVTVDGQTVGYFRGKADFEIDLSNHKLLIIVDCENITILPSSDCTQVGISIAFSENCTLQQANISTHLAEPLNIQSSDYIVLRNCNLNSYWGGIRIVGSHHVRMTNMVAINSTLYVTSCTNGVFEDSFFAYVDIHQCSTCVFRNLKLFSTDGSLIIYESIKCTLTDIQGNAPIYMAGELPNQWEHTLTNVSFNGIQVGYFYRINDSFVEIGDFGQLFLISCNNLVAYGGADVSIYGCHIEFSDNIIIENVIFRRSSHYSLGLFNTRHTTIRDSKVDGFQDFGVYGVTSASFVNCTINQMYFTAYNSQEINITDSVFTNSHIQVVGVSDSNFLGNQISSTDIQCSFLEDSIFSGNRIMASYWYRLRGYALTRCSFIENEIECTGNAIGIDVDIGDTLLIRNNTIRGGYDGINMTQVQNSRVYANRIYNCDINGIAISSGTSCIIESNLVYGTSGNGVNLAYSSAIHCRYNVLANNTGYGINVQTVTNSFFWGNFFDNNTGGDAREMGIPNHWSFGGIGNYWADQDTQNNATIIGGNLNYDFYPLDIISSDSFPIVTNASDMYLTFDQENASVTWIVWNFNACRIEVIENGNIVYSTYTNFSTAITYTINNLAAGYYNLTIAVYCNGTLHTSDTVIAVIQTPYNALLTIVAITGIVAIVMGLEYIRKRKRVMNSPIEEPESPIPI